MNQLTLDNLKLHVPIVAWLLIISSGMLVAIGVIGFFVLTTLGVVTQDPTANLVLGTVGTWGSVFFLILAVPGFLAGYGLLQRREWGRILAIVLAFLSLLNFPLGTLLGVYAFWVLLQTSANEYFGLPTPSPA